jgi:hypothetical protein
MCGFIGGLCGLSLAIFSVKQFFVKHYMRYYRTKDYLNLHNKVICMSVDVRELKRQLSIAQRDIYDLTVCPNK